MKKELILGALCIFGASSAQSASINDVCNIVAENIEANYNFRLSGKTKDDAYRLLSLYSGQFPEDVLSLLVNNIEAAWAAPRPNGALEKELIIIKLKTYSYNICIGELN